MQVYTQRARRARGEGQNPRVRVCSGFSSSAPLRRLPEFLGIKILLFVLCSVAGWSSGAPQQDSEMVMERPQRAALPPKLWGLLQSCSHELTKTESRQRNLSHVEPNHLKMATKQSLKCFLTKTHKKRKGKNFGIVRTFPAKSSTLFFSER